MNTSRRSVCLALMLAIIPVAAQATPPTAPPPDPCAYPIQSYYTIDISDLPSGIEIGKNGGTDPEITVTSSSFLIVETWGYKYKFNNKEKYFFDNGWRDGNGMLVYGLHISNLPEIPQQNSAVTTAGITETPFTIKAQYGGKDIVILGKLKQITGESACKNGTSVTSLSSQEVNRPSLWARFWTWIESLF